MAWFWWATREGKQDHRINKELAALEHLRKFLKGEKARLALIEAYVVKMEKNIKIGDFAKAELFVPPLVRKMREKGLFDEAERHFLKKFKRTFLRQLHKEGRSVRKSF